MDLSFVMFYSNFISISSRAGKSVNDSDIVTFCVDHKTGRELRQYLSSIADKCDRQQLTDLPHVIILDGLHHVTSPLGDTFNGFLNVDYQSRYTTFRYGTVAGRGLAENIRDPEHFMLLPSYDEMRT